jgi:hypothetical protein
MYLVAQLIRGKGKSEDDDLMDRNFSSRKGEIFFNN